MLQITPIVAAAPKAVPVKNEIRQFNKNVSSKKTAGCISLAARHTITEIVPASRQMTVSMPIRKKVLLKEK